MGFQLSQQLLQFVNLTEFTGEDVKLSSILRENTRANAKEINKVTLEGLEYQFVVSNE